jgi:hypothetical protein
MFLFLTTNSRAEKYKWIVDLMYKFCDELLPVDDTDTDDTDTRPTSPQQYVLSTSEMRAINRVLLYDDAYTVIVV